MCLETIYRESTGRELEVVLCEFITFLCKFLTGNGNGRRETASSHFSVCRAGIGAHGWTTTLDHILHRSHTLGFGFVSDSLIAGDNPEADIRGANAAGERFFSILVRTGAATLPLWICQIKIILLEYY